MILLPIIIITDTSLPLPTPMLCAILLLGSMSSSLEDTEGEWEAGRQEKVTDSSEALSFHQPTGPT